MARDTNKTDTTKKNETMTQQDIIKEWRDANRGTRNCIVTTIDDETGKSQTYVKAVTPQDITVMLLMMFDDNEAYYTAAKDAIEMYKKPNIQQILNDSTATQRTASPERHKS